MSVFHICCANGSSGCVDALVDAGCSVSCKTADGKTGRDLASAAEHSSVLQSLDRAMIAAAKAGDTERVTEFLDIGVSIDAAHAKTGRTSLMEAANGGHDELHALLLQRQANFELSDKSGATALILAS